MNPRTLLLPIVALVLCPWLVETASAQRPRVERVKPPATVEIPEKDEKTSRARPRRTRTPRMVRLLPDLRCVVTASKNEDGSDPIPGESTITYGGGSPTVWAHVTFANHGKGSSDEFFVWINVRNNGNLLTHPYYGSTLSQASLAAGESRPVASSIKIPLLASSNHVEVVAFVDHQRSGGDRIEESDDGNNACGIRFTANILQ